MIAISNDIFQTKFHSIQKLTNKELPLSIARGLVNTIDQLREGQKAFETKRLEIAQKYADTKKDGGFKIKDGKYSFTKKAEQGFKKDHDKLLKEEQEYNIELIELPEDFKISAADLILLKDTVIKI